MAKKPIPKKRPLRPDSPMDSPRHERTESAREQVREYGRKKR